jgi:hypothetical protein
VKGPRCRRRVPVGENYCGHHAGFGGRQAVSVGIGAITGGFLGGPVGAIVGGLFGASTEYASRFVAEKKNVFLSFHYKRDRALRGFLVQQSKRKNAPFSITDGSLREAAPEAEWRRRAEEAIGECDLVMVLLGRDTYKAPGVLVEVDIAHRLGKPIVQIYTQRGMRYRFVPGAGRVYLWDWQNLAHILE